MKQQNDINALFMKLFDIFSTERFLTSTGTAGELPYYVQTYRPQDLTVVERNIPLLIDRLGSASIRVLEINLYRLCISLLEEHGNLESVFEMELEEGKENLFEALQASLDVETILLPAITAAIQAQEYHICFVTGVGAVFPYIRTHTILNNLARVIRKPLVVFFPGNYDGYTLTIFGRIKDEHYYRAFLLDDYKV